MTRSPLLRPWQRAAVPCGLAVALSLAGCTTNVGDLLAGDKVDYRSATVTKTAGLEVPPDLTQLTRDSRYQQTQTGSVSAAAYQAGGAAATAQPAISTAAAAIAPSALGDVRIERDGSERWLRTSQSPEQLWPQLRTFWKDNGFVLTQDLPGAGVMETDWAENRAKLPQDIIRSTVGRVFDGAYSTGELDKYRTRVERVAGGGSEVYISHRGMQEVYIGERKEQTSWQPRPPDPQLEGEFLAKLMQKLGARPEAAKSAVLEAAAPSAPAKARIVAGQPAATLQVDDGFDRAWRRVGVALDRSGFTVEDRDRTQGVYFVRYVDPSQAGKEEPNLFQRLFSFGKKDDISGPAKYRVAVKSDGAQSNVTVLNNNGGPENGEAGRRITQMLLDELK